MHLKRVGIVLSFILSSLLVTSCVNAATPFIEPNCTSKCIGMEYENWFPSDQDGVSDYWSNPGTWGTPLLGDYNSDNTAIIDKHAEWLNDLGVDFVLDDWTNSHANAIG